VTREKVVDWLIMAALAGLATTIANAAKHDDVLRLQSKVENLDDEIDVLKVQQGGLTVQLTYANAALARIEKELQNMQETAGRSRPR
jgi:hypothetical protein